MVSKVVFCSSRCLYMKTNNNPASRFSSDFLLLLSNFTNVSVCRNIYIYIYIYNPLSIYRGRLARSF